MPEILIRTGRGIVFFVLMYFGLTKIGIASDKAALISLIPFVSSVVNIMTYSIFSFSIVVFAIGIIDYAMDGYIMEMAKKLLEPLLKEVEKGKN